MKPQNCTVKQVKNRVHVKGERDRINNCVMAQGRLSFCVCRVSEVIRFRVKLFDSTHKFFEVLETVYPRLCPFPKSTRFRRTRLSHREKQGEAMNSEEF